MKKLLLLAMVGLFMASCSEDDDSPNNCQQPGSINIEQLNSTSILFSWGIDTETAWEVEYGPVGFALGTGTVRQTSQESFFIEGLEPATEYRIYLRTNCGSDGFSEYISVDVVTAEPTITCNPPSNLQLVSLSDTTIELSWDENNETAWEIEYGPTGFALGTGTVENTSQNSFNIEGLSPSTTYEIYVRANCGSDGFSTYSDALVITTDG